MTRGWVGKGNPYKYWEKTGVHFGYPKCCIDAFLKDECIPSSFDGTGYRTCVVCSKLTPESVVEGINSRRNHPEPFPNSDTFVKKFRESFYED